MPDSSVTTLAQTPDGYLWVGTYNGLARFDGSQFVTFDPENTPALGHARIRRLHVDKQGALWINSFDGSLTRFRNGRFSREWTGTVPSDRDATLVASSSNSIAFILDHGDYFQKNLDAPAGAGWTELVLPNRNMSVLPHGDGQSVTWFNGATIRMWRWRGLRFELFAEASGMLGRRIRSVVADGRGNLKLATDQQIALWDGQVWSDLTPTNGEAQLDVRLLVNSEDEGTWCVAGGRVRKAQGQRWVAEASALNGVLVEESGRLGGLSDGKGGVWLYDFGRGVAHAAADGSVWRYDSGGKFPGERVTCMILDREGVGWAGFQQGGLVRIIPRRFKTITDKDRESKTAAHTVAEDAQGKLWFGFLGGGLGMLNGSQMANFSVPGDLPRGSVFSAWPDSSGRLWLSAGAEDLHYLDEQNAAVRVNPVVHGVKTILEDSKKRLWVGTRSGLMMSAINLPAQFESVEGLESVAVRAMAEDRKGRVWCGGGDGTLYCISDNGVEAFRPEDASSGQAIWSLLADDDGTIWAGTFRGGLLRFRDGKFVRFSKAQGLADNVVAQILADDHDHLWLGTHRGVMHIARAELEAVSRGQKPTISCNVFGRSDGLPSLECSGGYQPAAWRSRDGRLWFTTLRGIVSVQPETLRLNPLPPRLHIEEVLVAGKVVWSPLAQSADGRDAMVGNTISSMTDRKAAPSPGLAKVTLEIPPGRMPVEIRYAALSLSAPERVEYQHRLAGDEEHWVEAGSRRFAHYSALGPGDYQFQLKACNSDGVWSEEVAALTLRILPHFYETWWFRAGAVLLGVAILLGIGRHRLTTKFRRQAEVLERRHAVERERARIARDIHDDVGASLNLIAVLGDLARQDKTGERMEKVSGTAREAMKSLDEIVWAVNPRNDSLAHLIDYTGQFAVDYLRAARVRCRLDVPDEIPLREIPSNVRHNLFLVVKETAQNVVKHAGASEVWLTFSVRAEGLKVTVKDNGRGFEQLPEDALADGLRNMRQRLQEIGGVWRIESRLGTGTEVTIELPWPQV